MRHFRPIFLSSVTAALVTLASGQVRGQEVPFGEKGGLVLSAERLTGFVHSSADTEGLGDEPSQDYFFLLGNPLGNETGYSWPRLALDGFIAPHISLGAAASYAHITRDALSLDLFLLAPRVGYVAGLSSRVAIWPRVGFTYLHLSGDGDGDGDASTSASWFALTIEAPFVIAVAPHAAVTIGPTLDLGLGGNISVNNGLGGTVSIDRKITEWGAQGSLLIFF